MTVIQLVNNVVDSIENEGIYSLFFISVHLLVSSIIACLCPSEKFASVVLYLGLKVQENGGFK